MSLTKRDYDDSGRAERDYDYERWSMSLDKAVAEQERETVELEGE